MAERATIRSQTLLEAVLDFLAEQGSVTRERLFERFRQASAEDVGGVLNDLVCRGVVHFTGRGASMTYGLSSTARSSSCWRSSW
jgi:hypothetical protein